MSIHRSLTDNATFNNHPIQTNKAKGFKCDKKILKRIDDTFNHAIETHKIDRLFFMRYDVRFPQDYQGDKKTKNEKFRTFQAKFIKNLERKDLKPHYIAVREQSREKHCHYHGVLLLDERKTRSIYNHIKTAEKLWANTLDISEPTALIDDCTKGRNGNKQQNGIKIEKNSSEFEQQFDKAFEWASYLAKENTKANNNGTRELFSSRLKHQ